MTATTLLAPSRAATMASSSKRRYAASPARSMAAAGSGERSRALSLPARSGVAVVGNPSAPGEGAAGGRTGGSAIGGGGDQHRATKQAAFTDGPAPVQGSLPFGRQHPARGVGPALAGLDESRYQVLHPAVQRNRQGMEPSWAFYAHQEPATPRCAHAELVHLRTSDPAMGH